MDSRRSGLEHSYGPELAARQPAERNAFPEVVAPSSLEHVGSFEESDGGKFIADTENRNKKRAYGLPLPPREPKPKRILGVSTAVFWAGLALLSVIILAIAIGAGLAVGLSNRSNANNTAPASASSTLPTSSITSSLSAGSSATSATPSSTSSASSKSSTSATSSASSAPSPASGKVTVVQVGQSGTLTYAPSNVRVAVGDMVQFQFTGGNHSVTQSTFDAPCEPIGLHESNAGIFSGFQPAAASSNLPTFTIQVKDTKPIWLYCAQARHCQLGMAMVINEDTAANATQSLANYQALAADSTTIAP